MEATAKDLRFNSKELINAVSRGEEVVITFRGRPCAKLIPYNDEKDGDVKSDLFGIWKDNDKVEDVNKYIRSCRNGRY